MAEQFEKDFDEILNDILTDYQGLDNQPDTSVGSTTWIIASVLASMIWGLYRYQDYISLQHFPDTADTNNLNHWGSIYDVTRLEDDSDADYVIKILEFLRQPPAGGNALDYENWALDRDECYYYNVGTDTTYYNNFATVQDWDGGVAGFVGVYTVPSDETGIPGGATIGLRNATQTYIDSVRPLGMIASTVYDATRAIPTVIIEVYPETDGTVNIDIVKQAVIDNMALMKPGQSLFKSTLTCIPLNYGADRAVVQTPSLEVTTPSNFRYYRGDTTQVIIDYDP